jgi:hypothetical protein
VQTIGLRCDAKKGNSGSEATKAAAASVYVGRTTKLLEFATEFTGEDAD